MIWKRRKQKCEGENEFRGNQEETIERAKIYHTKHPRYDNGKNWNINISLFSKQGVVKIFSRNFI